MAKVFVQKTLTGWSPSDDQAREMHKKHKLGRAYRAEIVQPRNYRHHCLFMALLDLTYDNQERYKDFREFRTAIAHAAGHGQEFVSVTTGEVLFAPCRYSYDDIPDEQDFSVEFGKAMTVCARILQMNNLDELEAEVSRYADEHYGRAAA